MDPSGIAREIRVISAQVLYLLWRKAIISIRGDLFSRFRTFVIPAIMLFVLFMGKRYTEISGVYTILPYAAAGHLYALVDYLVVDRSSGLKGLMTVMGLRRSAYVLAFLLIGFLFTSTVLVIISFNSIIYSEPVLTRESVHLALIAYNFELIGLILVLGSLVESLDNSSLSISFVAFDSLVFNFLKPIAVKEVNSLPLFVCALSSNSIAMLPDLKSESQLAELTGHMSFWAVTLFAVGLFLQFDGVRMAKRCAQVIFAPSAQISRPTGSERQGLRLQITRLTKNFYNSAVIEDVSLDLCADERLVLLGNNCAGKTTLMRLVVGQIEPSAGRVDLLSDSPIGYCPQFSVLDEQLTIREHLDLFCALKSVASSRADRDTEVDSILADVNLATHSAKRPSQLSGGMKRRLSLALALVGGSQVLVLDEPSSGFDPGLEGDTCLTMWNAIKRHSKGRAVLLSTHNTDEAEYLHTELLIMRPAHSAHRGTLAQLRTKLGLNYMLRVESKAEHERDISRLVGRQFGASKLVSSQSRPGCPVFDLQLSSPADTSYNGALVHLLAQLESEQARTSLTFKLRCSTLEDIMLYTDREEIAQEAQGQPASSRQSQIDRVIELNRRIEDTCCAVSAIKSFGVLVRKQLQLHRNCLSTLLVFRLLMPILHGYLTLSMSASFMYFSERFLAPSLYSPAPPANQPYLFPPRYDPFSDPLFMLVGVVVSMTVAHFVYLPCLERTTGFKILQLMGGLSPWLYWLQFFLLDLLCPLVLALAVVPVGLTRYPKLNPLDVAFHNQSIPYIMSRYLLAAVLGYLLSTYFSNARTSAGHLLILFLASPLLAYLDPIAVSLFPNNKAEIRDVWSITLLEILPESEFDWYLRKGSRSENFMKQLIGYIAILVVVEYRLLAYNPIHWLMSQLRSCRQAAPDNNLKPEDKQEHKDKLVLVIRELSKSYRLCRPVVKRLSLWLAKGECLGLLGANGAGKSTTLKMIVRECAPDSGSVWTCGYSLWSLITNYRRKLGYKPQPNVDISLTASQALTCVARLRKLGAQDTDELVSKLLELLGMGAYANRLITQLSGGTKRKLSLAMSLLGSPELLVLDEPTTGIDVASRNIVWRLLACIRQRTCCSIIMSSHSLLECEAVCDRVAVLADGEVRELGSVHEMRRQTPAGAEFKVSVDASLRADATLLPALARDLEDELRVRQRLPISRAPSAAGSVRFTLDQTDQPPRSEILRLLDLFVKPPLKFEYSDLTLESHLMRIARQSAKGETA